jgi:hypothetical protein
VFIINKKWKMDGLVRVLVVILIISRSLMSPMRTSRKIVDMIRLNINIDFNYLKCVRQKSIIELFAV